MEHVREHIMERYDKITKPGHREAMDKYGFMLDPAETRMIDGRKHYRVICPGSKKGGWSPDYDTPKEMHIPDPINSIKSRRER